MRLATRTAWAALIAASLSLLAIGIVFRGRFDEILQDRVDSQLEDRAETAPILAAVADRLSRSELVSTVDPARVERDGVIVELGHLPDDPLPNSPTPGWQTVDADGERWRLYTIEVLDVPAPGDRALVELAAPLGDVDAEARKLRGRILVIGLSTAMAAGLVGWFLGRVAVRPLTALRRDTQQLDDSPSIGWQVAHHYGSPEVDDVAEALNVTLARLAEETTERERALESARAFAATASHELRTPLQGALSNLDIARSARADDGNRRAAIGLAHGQVQRMASALAAVRALADAELVDPSWFEPTSLGALAELVAAAVADERRRIPGAGVTIDVRRRDDESIHPLWRDGVGVAVANLVRNALSHGASPGGPSASVVVTVEPWSITVDDGGPGIAAGERGRVVERFHRGTESRGSGLGLTLAGEVAAAHGGSIEIGESPIGGARVVLRLDAPDGQPQS